MLQSIQERVQTLLHSTDPLSEDEVQSLIEQEPELAKLLILTQSRRLRELEEAANPSPSTPSGMVAVYQKPAVKKRKKKPGRPKGHEGVRSSAPPKIDREVVTERDLFHCGGIFYELPARNAGNFAKIHPVSSHNFRIKDYCSYRGMLIMTGVSANPPKSNPHIIRSDDGTVALWAGVVDDLWKLGKPRRRRRALEP